MLQAQFCKSGFTYKQILREGNVAIFEKTWSGCFDPSISYEIIRIRRHCGFKIRGVFTGPAIARSQFKDGPPEELELRELKQFDHTIIAAQPKQHAATRPAAANAARLLLDIIAQRA